MPPCDSEYPGYLWILYLIQQSSISKTAQMGYLLTVVVRFYPKGCISVYVQSSPCFTLHQQHPPALGASPKPLHVSHGKTGETPFVIAIGLPASSNINLAVAHHRPRVFVKTPRNGGIVCAYAYPWPPCPEDSRNTRIHR